MSIKQMLSKNFLINELRTILQYRKYLPLNRYPHGHFYSPITSKKDINQFREKIWEESETIKGIDLNVEKQLDLLSKFEKFYEEIPFKEESRGDLRYTFNNNSYEYTDAIILYSFIRHFTPQNIIEIGSGHSSALMLDTLDIFDIKSNVTFIEPYPKLLYNLIKKEDKAKHKIIESKVQAVNEEAFKKLKKDDILFIDSSHISKTGSDVNYELFNILPNLNSGVIIHFHDIFYPFEYPEEWVLEGRNWNENYLLRAFLSYNNDFEILFFSQFIHKYHKESFSKMPLAYKNFGGNLWLRKK